MAGSTNRLPRLFSVHKIRCKDSFLVEFLNHVFSFMWLNFTYKHHGHVHHGNIGLTFKHSLQIFERIVVRTLGRPFLKPVLSIPQPCLMCVFESCEVTLRNSGTVLLLHYSIHFMQCTRFIGSKTTSDLMLPPTWLTAGTVFLELTVYLSKHIWSLWPSLIFTPEEFLFFKMVSCKL